MTERRNEKLHLIKASPSSPVSKVAATAGTTPTIANKKNKDDSSSVTSLTTADSVLRQDELDPSETSIDASSDASHRASLDFLFSKNHATSPHHRSLSCLSLGSASSSSYQRKGRPAGFRDRMQRRQSERQFKMDDEISSSHSSVSSPTRYQQQRQQQRLRRNPNFSSYVSNQGVDDKYIRNDGRNTSLPSEEENITTLRLVQKIRQLEQENVVQKERYAATLRNFPNNHKTVDSNKEKLLEEQLKEMNSKLATVEQQADVWRLENETLQQRLCKSQTVVKELETQQKQHLEIIARLEQNQRNAIEKESSHFQDITRTTMTPPTTKTETETETAMTETTSTNVTEVVSQSSWSMPVGEQEENESTNMLDRNEKLAKLKAFRRSREISLKELVIEKQNSTTDVQACISNLQDELRAAKEVVRSQAICIESMKEQKQTERRHDQSLSSSSMGAQIGGDCIFESSSDVTPRRDFEAHFQVLKFQYIKLELDRAYGEFQLRDRITEDALKFHRRLRHWKDQLQDLQKQLDTKQLELDWAAKQEFAVQQDLQEVKRSYQNTLQQFAQTQDRIQELEHEVLCYKQRQNADTILPQPPPSSTTTMSIPGSRDASAECLQQSSLLQAAKDRKDSSGSQKSWGSRWTKFLQ